jgi:hypothetical protein
VHAILRGWQRVTAESIKAGVAGSGSGPMSEMNFARPGCKVG